MASIQSLKCGDQPDGTFLASLENVRNYVICQEGAALNFQCQLGYFANEKTRSCDHIQQKFAPFNDVNPCDDLDQDDFVNNPASCSAFWVCVEDVPIDVECPSETPNFNPAASECQTNEQYPCTDDRDVDTEPPTTEVDTEPSTPEVDTEPSTPQVDTDPPPPTTTEKEIETETTPPEIVTEPATTQAPFNPCATKPNGWFVNDPSSCPAYFLCWNHRPRRQVCQDYLPFNEAEQMCDWQFECVDGEETTTTAPTEPPPFNPCANKKNGFFANDERSCSAFFLCWNEVGHERNCEDNLPFNEKDQLCDWQFDCVDPITDEPNETTPSEVTPTTPKDGDSGEHTTTVKESEEDETTDPPTTVHPPPTPNCPATGNVNIFHPGSCTKYWMCLSGVPHPRECADNLHFDSVQGGCNNIAAANCFRDICPIVDDPNNMVTHGSKTDCAA